MANIDTTKFMTLVVTLVVGTVLITGVLVPVIANTESGNGTTEKRLVNDLYEITSACGVTIPDKYHSYDYYNTEHSSDVIITKEDLLALYDISITSTSEYYQSVPLLIIYFPTGTFDTYPDWNGFQIVWDGAIWNGSVGYQYFGGSYSDQRGEPEEWSEFEFNFNTGALHIVDKSNTVLNGTVSEAYVISEKEDGVLPFYTSNEEESLLKLDDSISMLQIEKGVKLKGTLTIELNNENDNLDFFIGNFDDTMIQFTDNGISIPNAILMEADDPDNHSTCTMDATIPIQDGKYNIRGDMEYSNISCPEQYSVGDDAYPSYYIDTISTVVYSEGSGGSDSPAMTILYVVPLLMIVGMVLLTMNFVFKKE